MQRISLLQVLAKTLPIWLSYQALLEREWEAPTQEPSLAQALKNISKVLSISRVASTLLSEAKIPRYLKALKTWMTVQVVLQAIKYKIIIMQEGGNSRRIIKTMQFLPIQPGSSKIYLRISCSFQDRESSEAQRVQVINLSFRFAEALMDLLMRLERR